MARTGWALGTLLPGAAALAAVLGVAALALIALGWEAAQQSGSEVIDNYTLRVAGFTFVQALLSVLVSVVPGIWVARALARRPAFPGRTLLLQLFGLPLVTPAVVAIFGLAAAYGTSGAIGKLATMLGWPGWHFPYGLPGILIAHAFFNLPLSVRLLLPALEAIPGESWRLAAQLGMRSGQIFRQIEWPVLRSVLPGVAGLVFLLCFSSFTVVLVFGGGPRASTLEVAIYQALRLDFDLQRAVGLALLQVGLCAGFVLVGQRLAVPAPLIRSDSHFPAQPLRPDARSRASRIHDTAWISLAGLFVGVPLLAILFRAAFGPVAEMLLAPGLQDAVIRTILVGVAAGSASLVLGWAILVAARHLRWRRGRGGLAGGIENVSALNLVVSPIAMSAGLFILLLPFVAVFDHALVLAAIVNAVITTPYVIRILGPEMHRVAEHHDRVFRSLGMRGWNRFRLGEWPMIRRAAGRAAALTTGLAMGDLAAIALFGNESSTTLPLYLYRLMAAYRMEEAAAVAGLLALLCLGTFVFIERLIGGPRARA